MIDSKDRNVLTAGIEVGYRSIDTAQVYRNEQDIGDLLAEMIADNRIKREEIFITTKISPRNAGEEKAYASVLESLAKLKTEYIDLMLIHWPGSQGLPLNSPKNAENRKGTWKTLERLKREGKLRQIGVSNFTIRHLRELLSYAEISPAFEIHPLCYPQETIALCRENGIQVQAYSSLGEGNLLDESNPSLAPIGDIATKHKASRAQVLLKWALQLEIAVIPKSSSTERVKQNYDLHFFKLDEEDMETLSHLTSAEGLSYKKYCWDPETVS
ncbi:hypothetical protein HDU76_006595 [Blyttiomyces sp. JEL0837]|nr:hypothetical protein HDU76_006595 [Blyttiomyces sp. JEL0837]